MCVRARKAIAHSVRGEAVFGGESESGADLRLSSVMARVGHSRTETIN